MRSNIDARAVRLQRVENIASVGDPDGHALCAGRVTMWELKAVRAAPVRPETPVLGAASGLSVEQRNWHLSWCRHGGRSVIIVGVGSNRLFVVPGRLADELNSMSLAELGRASLAGSWKEVAAYFGAVE
jgi:hypothetical protein